LAPKSWPGDESTKGSGLAVAAEFTGNDGVFLSPEEFWSLSIYREKQAEQLIKYSFSGAMHS
jgi:hypothetical protein